MDSEKVVISVGGSLIAPKEGINTDFLKNLNRFIRERLAGNPNRQFFLIIGGGYLARIYRDAGKDVIGTLTRDDLDWLGIHATRLNAHLVRTIFRDIANPVLLEHYDKPFEANEQVIVGSGWKPGWSTDYCATMVCENFGAKEMINLTNVDQVYDSDPKKNPNAKPLSHMTWDEMRVMIGDEWIPGMNSPFDPIAAKKAKEISAKVVILNGHNFENFEKYFRGEDFIGTTIE